MGAIGEDGATDPAAAGGGSAGRSPSGSPGSSGGAFGGAGATSPKPDGPAVPGARPLRRLTRAELSNTMADLLGVPADVPAELIDVLSDSGYREGGSISKVEADVLLDWTGRLATAASAKVMALSGCAASPASRAEQDGCARTFIDKFGRRAFRRPLTAPERDELFAYYTAQLRTTLAYDHASAIRGLVWVIIQSPRFMYHWERPAEPAIVRDGVIALGQHEIAARLSYLFWSSMPDDALFAAADRGELATPAQVEMQARRLLADARGARVGESFVLQWLGIGDVSRMPKAAKYAFTPELGHAMLAESQRFVRSVFSKDGSLQALLTSSATTLDNPKLASVYGYTGSIGATPTAVTLDPTRRAGLLTSASFLTAQALNSDLNPIRRGLAVVEHLLCMSIPAPPNDIPPTPEADGNLSTRKRLAQHDENACASACHKVFDPAGMTFEHYDGIGAYRTMDGGEPVDASGTIRFPSGDTKTVANAVELTRLLAQSPDVRACLARQWLRYVLRRHDEDHDARSVAVAAAVIRQPNADLREMMIATTTSPAFTSRSPSPAEPVRMEATR